MTPNRPMSSRPIFPLLGSPPNVRSNLETQGLATALTCIRGSAPSGCNTGKAQAEQRRERAEREHLLMREVNHRAKNMLSLVQAIARQSAAREPEDFVGRFTERIQTLAANQDVLIRHEWHGVDIKDLVPRSARPLCRPRRASDHCARPEAAFESSCCPRYRSRTSRACDQRHQTRFAFGGRRSASRYVGGLTTTSSR
jgi:hypothetical protein